MSYIWGDSFDAYATAGLMNKWTNQVNFGTTGSSFTIGAFGRNGTQGLRIAIGAGNAGTSGTSVSSPTLVPGSTTCIFGFAFKPSAITNKTLTIAWVNNSLGAIQCSICLSAAGLLSVTRGGSTGTVLGTGTTTLAAGATNYIELKVIPHTTAGSFELRLNGVLEISGTGINTAQAATNDWGSISIGQNTATGIYTNVSWDYDDLYICTGAGADNNDFMGSVRLKACLVDSAGNYSQFTPSPAVPNWQNVDDPTGPDGDTTFNGSVTPGQIDTYGLAAIGLAGIVKAVQLTLAVRSNAGGTEVIAPVVRIGSTDYVGANIAGLTTSYVNKTVVYERSPATSAPWTVAEIDAAEFGLKLVS